MQGFLSNVFVYFVFWRSSVWTVSFNMFLMRIKIIFRWNGATAYWICMEYWDIQPFFSWLICYRAIIEHVIALYMMLMDMPSFPEEINMNIYTYHTRSPMKTDSIQIAPLKTESNDKKVFLCAICLVYVLQYVKVFLTALYSSRDQ